MEATIIANLQEEMKQFWGNSCYAYCIGFMRGLRTRKELTKFVLEAWYAGYVDDECYVNCPHKMMEAKDVMIVPYKESATPQIVMWEYNNKTHFVVMAYGKIIFDPSGDSNTVKMGKIKNARKFIY